MLFRDALFSLRFTVNSSQSHRVGVMDMFLTVNYELIFRRILNENP